MIKVVKDFDPGAGLHDGYKRLMTGIVLQALRDWWYSPDLEVSISGLLWLASPDCELYLEVIGLKSDGLQPICDGKRINKRIVSRTRVKRSYDMSNRGRRVKNERKNKTRIRQTRQAAGTA